MPIRSILLVLGWLATKRSVNTRAAYARDLGIARARRATRAPSWLTWCREQGPHPVTGVTGWHMIRYARQLDAAALSSASAARKLAAISSWYDWLTLRGHISASPATGLARPRAGLGTRPAPGLTRQQALALVRAADTAPGPQRARTAALIAVLVFAGARVGEVLEADVDDLGTDRGHRVLRVTRANGRRDGRMLPDAAASRIDAYLAERADLADGSVLFASRTGGRLFAADVGRAVRRLAKRAGLPANLVGQLGPHLIRRSFAAFYLKGRRIAPRPARRSGTRRTAHHPALQPGRPQAGHSPGPATAEALPGCRAVAGKQPHCRACGPHRAG